MNPEFQIIKPEHIQDNVFKLIGKDWMLVCAGTADNYNMMTASWGFCGILWNKPVAAIFIRPQRYTFEFTEKHDKFSLNFFDETFRKTLNVLGSVSGRDTDKMQYEGLDAQISDQGLVYFRQSRLVIECQKIYADNINPACFISPDIQKIYPAEDYHRFYIGEIQNAMVRE